MEAFQNDDGILPALNSIVQAMHGSQEYAEDDEFTNTPKLNYGLPPSGLKGMKFVGLCAPKPLPPPIYCPQPSISARTKTVKLYIKRCDEYSTKPNSGVLTTLRYGLREARVAPGFTDQDMLPFTDVLLCGIGNVDKLTLKEYDTWCKEAGCTQLEVSSVIRRIERLDFTRAMAKVNGLPKMNGVRSHGAVCLAKVLECSDTIIEVRLNFNKIGPYGAGAIFRALAVSASSNRSRVKVLRMRGCGIGERGARALAEHLICPGIDLAKEFASRTLLDYPDPLGPTNSDGCPCCVTSKWGQPVDPLRSAMGGARAPIMSSLQQLANNLDHIVGSPILGRSPSTASRKSVDKSSPLRSRCYSAPDLGKGISLDHIVGNNDKDGNGVVGRGKLNFLGKINEEKDNTHNGVDKTTVKHNYIMLNKTSKQSTSKQQSNPVTPEKVETNPKIPIKIPTSSTYPSMVEINEEHVLFIDLSLNSVGWQGLCILSLATEKRKLMNLPPFALDLDANSKLAEVMNSVTHGLGFLLCVIGTMLLHEKSNRYRKHQAPLMVYSVSLCTLYLSSTLYHSLYMMPMRVKEIFHFMDKAGIYLLIAGSYTPFLVILFPDKPEYSKYLLAFVWIVSLFGITVAAMLKPSKLKGRISLTLYLALGWTGALVVEDMRSALPHGSVALLLAGGVAYTGGVPLFVRNKNLDHAIWHLFVLAGSAFHWCCIFFYLAELP